MEVIPADVDVIRPLAVPTVTPTLTPTLADRLTLGRATERVGKPDTLRAGRLRAKFEPEAEFCV